MTSGDFEHKNQERWAEFERLVGRLEKRQTDPEARLFPRKFHELCVDLSLAESRMYGPRVTERLNALVIRGYELIYRTNRHGWRKAASFVVETFPRTVRAEWRLFWLCSLVFWLPFIGMLLSTTHDVQWCQAVLGPEGMMSMESMYGGQAEQIAHLRDKHGSNFMMFCFYINHNVGIDFQIFAGGILAGLGTLFYLFFNGIFLGAAASYVNHACNPQSFWSFVVGHSSYELLGMVVAGMAGMRLGLSLIHPGRLPRVRALTEAAKRALPLIYGAAMMTTIAAVIEGFWSAQQLPVETKYAFGAVNWLLVSAWLYLGGRRSHAA